MKEGRWIGELTFQHFETGAHIPVLSNIFRVDDPETGQPTNYATFTRDLNAQKRRETALADAQQRVASVLSAGAVGTWTFDVVSGQVVADANLQRFFSISEEDAAGGNIERYLQAIHPEDLPSVQQTIADAIEKHSTYLAEYRLRDGDDAWRHVIARGNVERDEEGKALRLPGVVLDVTQRVQAEEERRKALGRLEQSEERLRFSLEGGQIGAWDLDLVSNRAWRSLQHDRIFGYQDALLAWTFEDFLAHVVPEDRKGVEAAFQAALAGSDKWEVECRIQRQDGERRWIIPHGGIVRDENGKAVRMFGTVIDVTARKESEEAVREGEAKFRQLADTIPQLAWMADANGSIFWYNQRWYQYTGTLPDDMAGWGWQSVHDLKSLPGVIDRWRASLESGDPLDVVFPLKGADGEFRRFLTRVAPFRDQDGKIALWFGTHTDIEDQNRVAEALHEQREQLALALDAGRLGNWQLDLNTMEMISSEGCKANFGLPPDAALPYEKLWETIHPEDRAAAQASGRSISRKITKQNTGSCGPMAVCTGSSRGAGPPSIAMARRCA